MCVRAPANAPYSDSSPQSQSVYFQKYTNVFFAQGCLIFLLIVERPEDNEAFATGNDSVGIG